ncbi:MAG: hypothetical protein ACLP1W_15330 [Rhodomicrobium sp.]
MGELMLLLAHSASQHTILGLGKKGIQFFYLHHHGLLLLLGTINHATAIAHVQPKGVAIQSIQNAL